MAAQACASLKAIQAMRSASHKNNLTEPRIKRLDELHEWLNLGVELGHYSFASNAGARIFRQITSACSFPRDG